MAQSKTIDIASTRFEGANTLRMYLHYDKGNGWNRKRGYYLSIRPVERKTYNYNGVVMQEVGFTAVDDRARTYFLEPAERFNQRVLDGYAERIEESKREIHDAVADGVYKRVWLYVYCETVKVNQ